MTPADTGTGLLAPGWAGSPAAAEAGDGAVLRALLDAEAALTRAQAATPSCSSSRCTPRTSYGPTCWTRTPARCGSAA
ncbi:hypothetical protein ABZ676_24185, partial [Streptomyces sp. NPDC006999]